MTAPPLPPRNIDTSAPVHPPADAGLAEIAPTSSSPPGTSVPGALASRGKENRLRHLISRGYGSLEGGFAPPSGLLASARHPDSPRMSGFASLEASLPSPIAVTQGYLRRSSMLLTATAKTTTLFGSSLQREIQEQLNWFLVKRQHDAVVAVYNASSETIASVKAGDVSLRARFAKIRATATQRDLDWAWWELLLGDYTKKAALAEMETVLTTLDGFPAEARGILYLLLLRAKCELIEEVHAEVVAGRGCDKNDELNLLLENYADDFAALRNVKALKDTLRAVAVYLGVIPSPFAVNAALIIHRARNPVPDEAEGEAGAAANRLELSDAEVLLLLVRLQALHDTLNKDEFQYKTNRTVEDHLPLVFLHLSQQGVSLGPFYKKLLTLDFFREPFSVSLALFALDMVIFQGPDFFVKFVLQVLTAHQAKILAHTSLEQTRFFNVELLNSENWAPDFIDAVLRQAPDFVKYENEYNLLNNNSLNLNNTELINLRETNEDLRAKLQDLSQKFEHLNTDHLQIVQENLAMATAMEAQERTKVSLTVERDSLAARVQSLGMHEEIMQTTERNERFERINADLRVRVEEMKRELAEKKERLAEATVASTVKPASRAEPADASASTDVPVSKVEPAETTKSVDLAS